MMSKSSFLVSLKENSKRRLWVWVVSALLYMLALPVFTALTINSITSKMTGMRESYEAAVVMQVLHERLLNAMRGCFSPSIIFLLMTAGIALISAIQGFSFLYSRKKMDFYMGMPVKRKKRFFVVWLNGILLYVLPYLLGLGISLQIAALNDAVDKTVLQSAMVGFGANLCAYLGIYHMVMVAVMLTGNVIITLLGVFIFSIYEFVLRILVSGYRQVFFQYYSGYGVDTSPMLSPFTMYMKLGNHFNYANAFSVKYALWLLGFALVMGLISYVCYIKRPAEAAGKAMTFSVTKPAIKILLTVPAALLAGAVTFDAVDFDPRRSMQGIGWVIFFMALAVVLGSGLIQVIYEFDIRGAVHKKYHILISGGITAMIFVIYQFDLFGYDAYIPKQDQIESVAFIPADYELGYSTHIDEGTARYVSTEEYADRYMELQKIEEICELVDRSMEEYNKLDASFFRQRSALEENQEEQWWSNVTLIYRLKNGRKVSRALWVNVEDERTQQLLDSIIGSKEFKEGFWMCASDRINGLLEESRYEVRTVYGNQIYSEGLTREETREFLEIYRKDLEKADFTNIRSCVPIGMLTITFSETIKGSDYLNAYGKIAKSTRSWEVYQNIYPFCKESIAYLKDHGCYMEGQLKLEDVAKIQVVNRNTEIARELQKQLEESGEGEILSDETPEHLLALGAEGATYDYDAGIDARVYADYTQEKELEEIAAHIYPESMPTRYWDHGKQMESDYEVIVYFKADSQLTKTYGPSAYYGFLEGEVPDFVKEDTLYRE